MPDESGNGRLRGEHAELVARGQSCCVNTGAKRMRAKGIAAKAKRKFRRTTDRNYGLPVADNVLGRRFDLGPPNEAPVADITYVPTRQGWLYLIAVEDLYSRNPLSSFSGKLHIPHAAPAVPGQAAGAG